MRLFSEIAKALGGEADPFRIQYTVIDGRGGYFRNVKRIVEFSPCEVSLVGRKGGLKITGSGFTLGKYCAGDLVVYGHIMCTARSE